MGSRLPVDARREQLLELGLRLFSARSYEDISINEIAEQAGISKGLLYHYFGGKRDFYTATIRYAAQRLLAALLTMDTVDPGPERARHGLRAYLDFVDAHAESYQALMNGGLGSDPGIQEIIASTRGAITARILASLGTSEERPIFRAAVCSWLGAVEAASLAWLADRSIDREALITLLLASLGATLEAAVLLDPEAGVVLPDPA